MVKTAALKRAHETGLTYEAYLATDPEKAEAWRAVEEQVSLDDEQRRLVEGFVRRMPVLVLSGIWCGDCAEQGPLLHRIAEGSPVIDLRWIDRDEHAGLAAAVSINKGARVPVAAFMAEDYEPVSFLGDRTLTRYRAMAGRQLGAPFPPPGPRADELRGTLQEWLDEFERVHLLLRLSGRLREVHGD